MLYFLARDERVLSKLRDIILSEFGPNQHGDVPFHRLKNCEYLNYCIQEVLRAAGVVPINERVCVRDTTIPRGGGGDGLSPVFLLKGQRILIANYAM